MRSPMNIKWSDSWTTPSDKRTDLIIFISYVHKSNLSLIIFATESADKFVLFIFM